MATPLAAALLLAAASKLFHKVCTTSLAISSPLRDLTSSRRRINRCSILKLSTYLTTMANASPRRLVGISVFTNEISWLWIKGMLSLRVLLQANLNPCSSKTCRNVSVLFSATPAQRNAFTTLIRYNRWLSGKCSPFGCSSSSYFFERLNYISIPGFSFLQSIFHWTVFWWSNVIFYCAPPQTQLLPTSLTSADTINFSLPNSLALCKGVTDFGLLEQLGRLKRLRAIFKYLPFSC